MSTRHAVDTLIGKTPLVDLSVLGADGVRILGKYEATNPGGSVKDRVALAMVDAAEDHVRLTLLAKLVDSDLHTVDRRTCA